MPSESAVRDGNGAGFELIETLRWEPARGFVRLERHMARLAASARELGFSMSETAVDRALRNAVGGNAALRVRLTLAQDGKPEITTQPHAPLAPDAVWTLKIAETRLNANDPLLHHKTTRRAVYDAARAEFSREEADEVILLNQHGQVCEGTITNIFADVDGVLLTPPLGCGLLPGVLRGELLESGKVREAVLTEEDLHSANAMFVGNSLRGLIRAGFGEAVDQ
ncbi:aminotransferase class IV family protein [Mesorhizobium sp. WSM2239]|uniref:Probable branched-chain-amino-acid aminotransferase n=2 Tax=unclassified Mesorhizobium TaxID=325217 RepID=A0AAU8DD69_9HYPH